MSWKVILKAAQQGSIKYQREHRNTIVIAFKQFWDLKPNEEQFIDYMDRVILFPEILHYMATNARAILGEKGDFE